jgi:DNA-directed RNA polymerase sigma subunit (sigma70/sigma32)
VHMIETINKLVRTSRYLVQESTSRARTSVHFTSGADERRVLM